MIVSRNDVKFELDSDFAEQTEGLVELCCLNLIQPS